MARLLSFNPNIILPEITWAGSKKRSHPATSVLNILRGFMHYGLGLGLGLGLRTQYSECFAEHHVFMSAQLLLMGDLATCLEIKAYQISIHLSNYSNFMCIDGL